MMSRNKKANKKAGSSEERDLLQGEFGAPANVNGVPFLSNEECVTQWNKLPGKTLGQHVDVVKMECLAPFLFGQVQQSDCWIKWAAECGMLPSGWDFNTEQLSEADLQNVEVMEHAFHVVTNTVRGKDITGLVTMLEVVNQCSRKKHLKDMLKNVYDNRLIKKWMSKLKSIIKTTSEDTVIMALLLVAQQYCDHIVELTQNKCDKVEEFESAQKSSEQSSESVKNAGNEDFKAGRYLKAVTSYNKAVSISAFSHILYGNRAQAHLRNKKFDKALSDGKRSVIIKPDWPKGWYRYAEAYFEMGSLKKAQEINSKALEACKTSGAETKDLLLQKKKIKETLSKQDEDSDIPDLCESSDSSSDSCFGDPSENITHGKMPKNFKGFSMPDLVDATDSDSSCMSLSDSSDAPALVTDSESDSDEEHITMKSRKDKSSHSHHRRVKGGRKAQSKTKERTQSDIDQDTRNEFQLNLKVGSEALLDERSRNAIQYYDKCTLALDVYSAKYFNFEEVDVVVLKYAVSLAAIRTGINEEIVKAITKLKHILTDHSTLTFPLVYYGLGLAYLRQNRFDVALEPLEKGLKVCSHVAYCVLTWPGTQVVIEETRQGKLQVAFQALIQQSLHPPVPDGVCRYEECSGYYKVQIYFTDPDFKGMISVMCEDKCTIDFHPNCWRKMKTSRGEKFSEKDLLGEKCFTPDCVAVVVSVKVYGHDTIIKKEFTRDEVPEKIKEIAKKPVKKQSGSSQKKLAKKQRKKEQKQAAKEEPQDEFMKGLDELEAKAEVEEEAANDEQNETDLAAATNEPDLRLHEDMAVVIKKEDDLSDLVKGTQKNKKKKKKEKTRKGLTLDEFIGPQESASVGSYQSGGVDPDAPFAVPEPLSHDMHRFHHTQPQDEESQKLILVKENLFSYFGDLLEAYGPLYSDDELIQTELRAFPLEAQTVIKDSGGLENFLKENLNFACMDGVLCLMKDAVKAQQLSSLRQSNTWQTVGSGNGNMASVTYVPSERWSTKSNSSTSNLSGGNSRPDTPSSTISSEHSRPTTPYDLSGFKESVGSLSDISFSVGKGSTVGKNGEQFQSAKHLAEQSQKNGQIQNIVEKETVQINDHPSSKQNVESTLLAKQEFFQKIQSVASSGKEVKDARSTSSSDLRPPHSRDTLPNSASLPDLQSQVTTKSSANPSQGGLKQTWFKHGEGNQLTWDSVVSDKGVAPGHKFGPPLSYLIPQPSGLYSHPRQPLFQPTKQGDCTDISQLNHIVSNSGSNERLGDTEDKMEVDVNYVEDFTYGMDNKGDYYNSLYGKDVQADPVSFNVNNSNNAAPSDELPIESRLKKWKLPSQDIETSSFNGVKTISVGVSCHVECCEAATLTDKSCMFEDDFKQLLMENENNSLHLQEARDKIVQLQQNNRVELQVRDKKLKELEHSIKTSDQQVETTTAECQKLTLDKKNLYDELKQVKQQLAQAHVTEKRLSDELLNKDRQIVDLATNFNQDRERLQKEEVRLKDLEASLDQKLSAERTRAQKAEVAFLKLKLDIAQQPLLNQLRDADMKLTSITKYLQSAKEKNRKAPLLQHPQATKDLAYWTDTVAKIKQALNSTKDAFMEHIRLVQNGRHLSTLPEPNIPHLALDPEHASSQQNTMSSGQRAPFNGGHFRYGLGSQGLPPGPPPGMPRGPLSNQGARPTSGPPGMPMRPPNTVTHKQGNNSFAKIMANLQQKFTSLTSAEIIQHIQTLRAQNKNSMSGLTLEEIVNRVSEMIMKSQPPSKMPNENSMQTLTPISPISAYPPAKGASNVTEFTEIFQEEEDPCIICHEELTKSTEIQLECNHRYHKECIRRWLGTNSTCPTCRVHVLLPDEFPTLK